jgi:hypothetical protein
MIRCIKDLKKRPPFKRVMVALAVGFLSLAPMAHAGETLLENPDFESGQAGWKFDVQDPNTVMELSSEAQSPFSKGTAGLHIRVREGAEGSAPYAVQELNPHTNQGLRIAFDFKINANTTCRGAAGVLVLRLFNARGVPTFVIVFRGRGDISLDGTTGSGKYERDVWNHAELDIPAAGRDAAVHLTLTPKGGSAEELVIEGGRRLAEGDANGLLRIEPHFGVCPVTDVYLDNVQVTVAEEKHSAK